MMKKNGRYKGLIMSFISFIFVFFISGTYLYIWVRYYNRNFFAGSEMTSALYGWKGNMLILGIYLVLVFLFSKIYNGFRIGTLRVSDIIYSQTLSMLFINIISYIQICLLEREVVTPLPVVGKMICDMIFLVFWALTGNRIYSNMYPPKKLVMVYGSKQAVPIVNKLGRRFDRFYIVQSVKWQEGIEKIEDLIDKFDGVILCDIDNDIRDDILKICFYKSKRAYIVPKISDILMRGAEPLHLIDTPLLLNRNHGLSAEAMVVKRLFDICASFMGLILASPIMIVTAICIKAHDGGPVLYTQDRLTRGGRIFKVYKFRSMVIDAERDGRARLAGKNDDRITPVGKVIRKCRIDELPQLINILKGDMSVVGPRPERPELAAENEKTMPEFRYRLKVKAGLTGYAQVLGKYNTSPYDKLRLDLMYIEQYSFLLDLKLILMTVKILFIPESTEGVSDKVDQKQ